MTDVAEQRTAAVAGTASARTRRMPRRLAVAALVLVLVLVPFVALPVPLVLPGALRSPGSLQVLAIALVFAGVAISYDVVFGYTGLLSFGHALFFALGVYGTNLLMERAGLGYPVAAVIAVAGAVAVAAVVGAVALRTRGVAFAMVTLAFAEAFSILLHTDPLRLSGGEEGLPIVGDLVPDLLRGVVNTRYLYWLALAYALVAFVAARAAVASVAGRVWQAIRENEDRVELLGLEPFGFKLSAFLLGCGLAALGGAVYLPIVRGANPGVASASFTLALLVMVVLGGAGRLWGAALGGLIYGLLTLRLSALGTSDLLTGLPEPAQRVLSEPLFVLGVLFVVLVLAAPQGLAGLLRRRA